MAIARASTGGRLTIRLCTLLLVVAWAIEALAAGVILPLPPGEGFEQTAPAREPLTAATAAQPAEERVAAWPPWLWGDRRTLYGGTRTPPASAVPDTPHPAVARIVVPEEGATAYGSGTLIDVRDQYGLVITVWHVVRDSQGTVEVVFPNGFRSQARPVKVDQDWDLAALVIWRPQIEPVHVSKTPPRPGDRLTIHGYGQGTYRIATGHCTQYFAPKQNFPTEMVELDVQARQGDSGGPIFNDRGEIAGVLFGAGEGTTIGSFAPRVETFLASLAPDLGPNKDQTQVAVADRPAPDITPPGGWPAHCDIAAADLKPKEMPDARWPSAPWMPPTIASNDAHSGGSDRQEVASGPVVKNNEARVSWSEVAGSTWFNRLKSTLAVVGIIAVALQLVRLVK
jgi:serine protease Do